MKIIKLLLPLYLLLILSCSFFSSSHPGAKEFYEVVKLIRADNTAAIERMSSYPVEKQIEIYLFANCCVEGGGGQINAYFTKNGEKKIPSIIKRIEVFPDDIKSKVDLIAALNSINKECNCLKKYPEYIKSLEIVEERLKSEKIQPDDNYKETYLNIYSDYLSDIKKQT